MKLRCLKVTIRQTPKRWAVESWDGNGKLIHRILVDSETDAHLVRAGLEHHKKTGGVRAPGQSGATRSQIEYRKQLFGGDK